VHVLAPRLQKVDNRLRQDVGVGKSAAEAIHGWPPLSDLLPNDQNDGHSRGLLDLAEVQLFPNGWIHATPRAEVYDAGVLNQPVYLLVYAFDESWRTGN